MRPIGVFDTLGGCQAAVNKTSPPPRGYTYQSKDPTLGGYAGHCYALSAFGPFDLHPQKGVASGRAPGFVAGEEIDCSNAAVDPRDRDHFLFSRGGEFRTYESRDGGRTVRGPERTRDGPSASSSREGPRGAERAREGLRGAGISREGQRLPEIR